MGQWRQTQTQSQRFPRVSTAVPVRVTTVEPEIDPSTGKRFFRCVEETTANLSRGGAYLRSWEPLAAGRRVVIAFNLNAREELQLDGRVAWTRRELRPQVKHELEAPGYGVEFVGGSSAELAALDRFLTSLEPKFESTSPSPTSPNTPRP
jgi:hypothetical protein